MKRLTVVLAAALAAGPVFAVDWAQVAPVLQANGCQGCHAVEGNVNGPSYHAIASKYADKPDARSYLTGKIRLGSSNVWGAAAMPPSGNIDDLDLKNIVEWLAGGAPGPVAPAIVGRTG